MHLIKVQGRQSIGEKAFVCFGSDASSCSFTAATGSQLTSIGTEAFRDFSGNVNLNNCKSLTTIGEKAFYDFKKSVYLPVSMRSIAKDAFYNKSYSGDKPKVYVAYDNSILYINDILKGTYDTSGTYDITTDINIKGNSSDAVSIRQYLTNSWGGGDGSSWEQAYVITNTFGLDLLAYYVNEGNDYNGKYFILGADITYTHATAWDDVTSTEDNYTAIGNPKAFKGHFDGQGHTVNGIRIYKGGNGSSAYDQGLFGYIAEGAEVTNVALADARITGYKYVGGIAGYSSGGTISNCRVHSNVCIHTVQIQYAWEHGGIVGRNYLNSTVSQCTSAAQLTVVSGAEADRYGGIAGLNNGTLEYNLAIGATIPNDNKNSCGIIVSSNDGTLTQNYYSGCTFAGTPNATGKGKGKGDVAGQAKPGYLLTLAEGITSNALTVRSYTVAPSGQTVTLGHNRPGYVPSGYVSSDVTITDGAFTMPASDVTVSTQWYDLALFGYNDDPLVDGSADHPYTISNADGWNYFCDALQNNATNNVNGIDGYFADVTLTGRTLYKDGYWNTLCLPFSLSAEQIAASNLVGADIRQLSNASIENQTLNLTFTPAAPAAGAVTAIEAGTPYIIKWTRASDYTNDDAHNIVSPLFTGVTIDATDRSYDNGATGDLRVRFLGTYTGKTFESEDQGVLLLGADDALYYPQPKDGKNPSIGAFRAYFMIGNGTTFARQLTAFNLNFGDDSQSIDDVQMSQESQESQNGWYTLDGRKLDGKPTKAGLYIHGGKKAAIK